MPGTADFIKDLSGRSRNIIEKLEEQSLELLDESVRDVHETGSEAVKALPTEDLRACLYMVTLRVLDFLRAQEPVQSGVQETALDFRQAFLEGAVVIVDAIDATSEFTRAHSRTVAKYAGQIAASNRMTDEDIEEIEYAALIHNIGRVNEKLELVESKRRLTDAELVRARDHCVVAAEMLRPIQFLTPIVPMVRHHHTRFDGTGYPGGVAGPDLPLGARIISIADAYHAMRSDRPYRKALSREEALDEIAKNAGKQFDPKLVSCAHDIWED